MKRLILSLCVALLLCGAAHAATVTVTVSGLTTKETDAANWKLATINAQRAANGQSQFANAKLWLENYINTIFIPDLIKEHAAATEQEDNIKALWENATPAQRAAAKAALGG